MRWDGKWRAVREAVADRPLTGDGRRATGWQLAAGNWQLATGKRRGTEKRVYGRLKSGHAANR